MRLTKEHADFRSSVRRFVDDVINPHADEWEAAGRFPAHDVFAKAAEQGLLGIEYDGAYGGLDADHSFQMVAAEELGGAHAAGVPLAIGVQTMMATPSLAEFGSEELKQRFLVPAIAGEHVAAIGVTEPDTGSDVASLRTSARRDGDDWVINGRKMYITNGAQADWICLLARTSDEGGHRGMSQIVVPTDIPGFEVVSVLDKLGKMPVAASDIDSASDLYDSGLTSHASVNVMIGLEDEFDIEFPDSMLQKSTFASIDAIAAAVAQLAG